MFLSNMLGANIFATIGLVFSYFGGIIVALLQFLLFMPMYLIFAGVMMIATFAEMTFKKLAGIDTIYLNGEAFGGGSGDGKDLVYAFITDSAVQDVFWSIVGLSIILLFIFTIVAMIKSEFTIDLKGSAKGPIIGRALKSLVNLLIVPVVTLISIFGTNFLTKTIYDLFDTTGDTVVTKCFRVGAYNANRVRSTPGFGDILRDSHLIVNGNPFSGFSNDDDLANYVDMCFVKYSDFAVEYEHYGFVDLLEAIDKGELMSDCITFLFFGVPNDQVCFNLFKMSQVNTYYNMAKFDWILAIGSGIVVTWTLLSVCLVLVKRVFELCILFLLAPPMTAIAPLDGGQAEKKWRGEFMKRLLAVIAPIFAYNMYFLMVPLFENISLFSGVKMAVGTSAVGAGVSMLGSYQIAITDFLFIFDIFFQLICVIVGLGIIKSASALLSNLLGVEDLVKSGGEAAKKAVDVGKKAALGATAIGGVAVKGAAAAIKGAKGAAEAIKNKKDTAQSRADAKEELAGEQEKETKAKEDLAATDKEIDIEQKTLSRDSQYQADKARLAELSTGARLSDEEKAEKAQLEKGIASKESNLKALQETRKGQQEAKDKASYAVKQREKGISSKEQAKMDALYSKTHADGTEKTPEEIAADAKKAEKMGRKFERTSIAGNIKAAYNSEFGEEAKTESVGAKVSTFINDKAQKLKNVPILNKIPELTNSLQEQFAINGSTAKRRLNDALAGMFGDGGGGDLWKIWFNKNARAGLYEGVPEAKMRTAKIEQENSWKARDIYYEKKDKEEKEKQEDKMIRRMLAMQEGGKFASDYRAAYEKIESGDASPAQIKKLEADIEKMEIQSGIADRAKIFAKAANNPDSEQYKSLQAFKEQMKQDASDKAVRDEQANKTRMENSIRSTGAAVETKITEQSSDQLAKAIERALSSGKGVKLNAEKGIKIDGSVFEGIKMSLDGVNSALQTLKQVLEGKKGDGNDNGGGGSN